MATPSHHLLPACAVTAAVLLSWLGASGCEGGDSCFDGVSADCTPAYEPTFDNVFTNTLAVRCGGSGCHGAGSAAGGLTFETASGSHALLVGDVDGVARALPHDAPCSVLVQRVVTDDADLVMPPGGSLPAAERCAIIQWVQNGAER